MSKSKSAYQPIYTMWIAMKLIEKGYTPCSTIPNPKKPELIVWIFKATPRFISDFEEITKEGYKWDE